MHSAITVGTSAQGMTRAIEEISGWVWYVIMLVGINSNCKNWELGTPSSTLQHLLSSRPLLSFLMKKSKNFFLDI